MEGKCCPKRHLCTNRSNTLDDLKLNHCWWFGLKIRRYCVGPRDWYVPNGWNLRYIFIQYLLIIQIIYQYQSVSPTKFGHDTWFHLVYYSYLYHWYVSGVFESIFFLFLIEIFIGIYNTSVNTETYTHRCTIVCVDIIRIYWLFSDSQYHLVVDFIILIHVSMTESSTDLNTCTYVVMSYCNFTVEHLQHNSLMFLNTLLAQLWSLSPSLLFFI